MTLLEVDIDHRWPRSKARLQVSFRSAEPCLALVGPSGAGKSSVLDCIAGLIRPTAGHVRIADRTLFDAHTWVPPHKRNLGLIPQAPTLFPLHTVRDNLAFGIRTADAPALLELAERLGLTPLLDRRPRHLSGGERQRVAIGRALLADPVLILADEPFSALDTPLRHRMIELLLDHQQSTGTPMVISTHDERTVAALGASVVQLPTDARPSAR